MVAVGTRGAVMALLTAGTLEEGLMGPMERESTVGLGRG